MFNKKILSGVLSICMLASCVSVAAAGFKDVEGDPTVAWAVPYINEMAEKGYIKGYEDGTFKPNNTISKTEALILLSRMIGVNDSSFQDSVEFAMDEYKTVLSKYSTNYAKEVSFLLYAGILDADELDTYISGANKNVALKRYEAAILLTKLLGAEEEVKTNAFVSSSYADTAEIPDSARAYVEYVKTKGIMQGMGNNDKGEPVFSPNTSVTRSQMAKMLCSLIDVIDLSSEIGTVVSTDSFNERITVTINGNDIAYDITETTRYKINGEDVTLTKIKKGMHVKVTHIAGKVALVENQAVIEDTVLRGIVASTNDSAGTQTVVLADANDSSKKESYILADGAKVRINGAIELFSRIKANDYVALTIEDGLVAVIEVLNKTENVYGKLVSIDVMDETTFLAVETQDGTISEYEVTSGSISVSRNELSASLADLIEGDTVSLRLTYNKVTKVQASSEKKNNVGAIEYITHSVNGTKIGINTGDDVKEYKVNKSVKVVVDSTENSTVYDLRPGTDINIQLESQEIIRIEAASAVVKTQLNGVVKNVNATYGVMVVVDGGTEYSVYANSNTKIIDSVTGRTLNLKGVEKNRTVSVTCSNASGVLEASVIVLQ